MTSLKIIFAGTPAFAIPCLDALADSTHHLQAIYTQPDRPAGRGRHLQSSAVKQWAEVHHLPIIQPLNFKNSETVDQLAAFAPDVIVVIAYGLILPTSVLHIPRLGCINVHGSLLPQWRGASPIQQAILHGDIESGVTIMQMDAGMDTGAMLTKVSCVIDPEETAGQLHDRLATIATHPLLTTLDDLANGRAILQTQDDHFASYAPKINKTEALIDWHQSAVAIHRQIRAFNPWPIAYTHVNDVTLRIYEAKIIDKHAQQLPGTIIAVDKHGIVVATGKQSLLITKIQFPGGKILSVADWLHAQNAMLPINTVLQ